MFLVICLNPTLQKTLVLNNLVENKVNRTNEYYLDASGKGVNVARVLVQLGEKVIHLTQLGGKFQNLFEEMLPKNNFSLKAINSHSEIRFSYTLLNKRLHTTTELVEESEPVDENTEKLILDLFNETLQNIEYTIISGSKAAGFTETIFPEMVKKLKKLNKTVLVDYREDDLINSLKYSPDFVKINLDEFIHTFLKNNAPKIAANNFEKHSILDNVKSKMLELHNEYNIKCIITDGKNPILYMDNGKVYTKQTENIIPVNTTGCGDSFSAGFLSSYSKNNNMKASIEDAIKCAVKNALLVKPGIIY